jgi:ApbE superfamily uncharacterized protein (UPF0280 family)
MDNDGDRKTFEVMTSAETLVTIGSMASIATSIKYLLLVMTLLLKIHCNVNHDFFALIEK